VWHGNGMATGSTRRVSTWSVKSRDVVWLLVGDYTACITAPAGSGHRLPCSAEEFPLDFEIGAELEDGGAFRIRPFGEVARLELVGFVELPRVVSHDSDERLGIGLCPARKAGANSE
jgi:hypothetical protein